MITKLQILLLLAAIASAQYTTIALVAINDIHGTALPTIMQRQDNKENYTYGGLQYMASMITTIQE
jgi:2',3'-cyclic-nucleotide 2'-phosphodiesterase (5'-nucleotidase family)